MTQKRKTRSAPSRDAMDELGIDALCDMILEGMSYRAIAAEVGVSLGGLNRWIAAEPDRLHACACARELSSQTFDELALEVLETAQSAIEIAKAREIAAHYRWRAKSANPKKYGDKQQVDMTAKVEIDIDQVDKKLERLLSKASK